MSVSLAHRVVVLAAGLLVAALVVTGVATAWLVHAQALAALDREILAAGHAFGSTGAEWEVEHSQAPVRVWSPSLAGDELPAEVVKRALATERPQWIDLDGERILLLVAEREEARREEDEEHRIVAAAAARPSFIASIAGFAVPYLFVATAVALVAIGGLGRMAAVALAPLERARRAAADASGAGVGVRLPEAGPEEVRALISAMNTLLARLDAAAAAQARFTAEAAHELRTPVTVLLGELDVALRRERDVATLRDTLVSTRAEVARLAALVEGLLALAQVDAGHAGRGREAVRLAEIAEEAARREALTLADAGCPFTMDVRADAEVVGNRALLVTAVANLLRNAATHAPGSPVRLTIDGANLVVADQGPGIPEAEWEAVFDRLTRGAGARRRNRAGLGLGLPLAREIARRHGGDCVLGDAPGGGCRVTFTLGAG